MGQFRKRVTRNPHQLIDLTTSLAAAPDRPQFNEEVDAERETHLGVHGLDTITAPTRRSGDADTIPASTQNHEPNASELPSDRCRRQPKRNSMLPTEELTEIGVTRTVAATRAHQPTDYLARKRRRGCGKSCGLFARLFSNIMFCKDPMVEMRGIEPLTFALRTLPLTVIGLSKQ